MSYVIYNKETTYILRAPTRSVGCYVESYKSEAAAKAALTRLDKKGMLGEKTTQHPTPENNFERKFRGLTKDDFAIADKSDFHANIEKTVRRTNLISGLEYDEPVNTPNYCSPASETYWSM